MSRHVIITGASRGIGSDIATAFVAAGDTVTALSRSGTAPAGVARSIAVDLADREATDAALSGAIEQSGPPAVLVANAGITRDNLALRMNDDDWDEVIETNLTSVFRTTRDSRLSHVERWICGKNAATWNQSSTSIVNAFWILGAMSRCLGLSARAGTKRPVG